jgi:uncharacterized protein with HEPN domain
MRSKSPSPFRIDWVAIAAAAGNIYRHEYEGVDEKLIGKTIQDDLDELREIIAFELERPNSE